tara:strand:- start:1920 stop:3599 length:1680 start_codon:yes stop_codon:yes gene_type:complete
MKYLALIIAFLISPLFKVIAADKKPALVPAGIKGRLLLRMPATKTTDNPEDPSKPSSKKGIHVITVGGRPDRWGKVNGGRGTSQFFDPHTIWIGADGHAYISEHWNHGVRRITAGNYIASEVANHLHHATGLCGDSNGNLYVTRFYFGDIIRIAPCGKRTVVQSGFNKPCAVAVDKRGIMWVANTYSAQIIRITLTGRRTVWNGMRAHHIALGPNGDLYVACQTDQTIRRIGANDHPEKAVEIIAGKPNQKGLVDGTVTKALFKAISGIAVSASGTIFVGDHDTIRRISKDGQVVTIAGNSNESRLVDGPAHKARFFGTAGLAIDSKGNLWVANRDKVVRLVLNAELGDPIRPFPPQDEAMIDLMIVYNPSLYSLYKSRTGMQQKVDLAVQQVNTALEVSQAGAQVRLVAVEPIKYKTAGNIGADLHRIRVDKEVSRLRARHKADLVCLVSEAGGGGVAFLGGGKSFGFSVIARHTILNSGWTLGHELGHNFGCPHNTGYAFKAGGIGYYTVMSMGPGSRGLLRYSNPDVSYKGTSTGTASKNNAGIIRRNAKRIAKFY